MLVFPGGRRAQRDDVAMMRAPLSVKDIDGADLSSGTSEVRKLDCWMSRLKMLISYVYRKLHVVNQDGMSLNENIFSGSLTGRVRSGEGLGSALPLIGLIA